MRWSSPGGALVAGDEGDGGGGSDVDRFEAPEVPRTRGGDSDARPVVLETMRAAPCVPRPCCVSNRLPEKVAAAVVSVFDARLDLELEN